MFYIRQREISIPVHVQLEDYVRLDFLRGHVRMSQWNKPWLPVTGVCGWGSGVLCEGIIAAGRGGWEWGTATERSLGSVGATGALGLEGVIYEETETKSYNN